jgi:chromosome segregation ATPase
MAIPTNHGAASVSVMTSARQESIAVAATVIPSLAGKSVTGWTHSFMMLGVAVAVVGVAASIFTGTMMATVGFGALGVVSLVGVFVAQSAMEGEMLQNSISQLNEQNAFLDDQTKKMDGAFKTIKKENEKLKATHGILEAKVQMLERENTRLIKASKDLDVALHSLSESNKSLEIKKVTLEKKVGDFEQYLRESLGVLDHFVGTNIEFASRVRLFCGAIKGLEDLEGNIRSMVGSLEDCVGENFPDLKERLLLAKMISQNLKMVLSEDKESQRALIDDYSAQMAIAERTSKEFVSYGESFDQSIKGISDRQTQMIDVVQNLERERSELEEMARLLEMKRQQFIEEKQAFSHEVEALKALQEHFARLIGGSVDTFDRKIRERDEEYQRMTLKLEAAEATLATMRAALGGSS